jgi:predicted aspartyl protease
MAGNGRRWRAALLAMASLVGAVACKSGDSGEQPPAESSGPSRVPMRIAAGLPLVEGRLPGDARAWFLIDTGAGDFTLLDQELTAALGLKHELIHDPLLPSIHFTAQVPFLEVGGMGRRNFRAYVAEDLSLRPELSGLGVKVHGVLGAGWFRGRCLWFDWGKDEFSTDHPRVRHSRHVALPLARGVSGELRTTIKLNGVACEALIDTGSAETLVSKEVADRLPIHYDAEKIGLHRETSIGAGAVRDAIVERVDLGAESLTSVPVLVIDRRLPNADLIVGTELLSHWGVILDLSDRPYLVLDPLEGKAGPEAREPMPLPGAGEPGDATGNTKGEGNGVP